MKIDLHTHSNCSDGTDSPTQLMHEATMAKLDVIALTDHDTIAGWDEAKKARRGNLQLVLGSEISCITEENISVHITALLFERSGDCQQSAAADPSLAGLNAMTQAFAHSFGPKVRVNCIMAGPFLTDAHKAWRADDERWREHALHRLGSPREIVGPALYFASDASSYTTGAILAVNGGLPT